MIPAYMDSLPRENLSHLSANPIIKYKNETIPRYLRLLSFFGVRLCLVRIIKQLHPLLPSSKNLKNLRLIPTISLILLQRLKPLKRKLQPLRRKKLPVLIRVTLHG